MSKKYYKGFNKDLQCTPNGKVFQYEVGKTYEEDNANLCQSGFHACEAPLDVFSYYAPGRGSRYCEVELEDVSEQREGDSKVVAKKITVGAEIGIPGLVKAHVEWVKSNCTKAIERGDAKAAKVGDHEAVTTGYCGSSVSGWRGSSVSGDYGSSVSGNRGSSVSGNRGSSVSGGSSSVGENGVAIARGTSGTKAKGDIGSILVLINENTTNYEINKWKAFRIDGKRYKPDTWYTLDEDGKVVKCEEAE